MAKTSPSQKLSTIGITLVGAGVGILLCWFLVYTHPEFIVKKANEEPYKTGILLLQVVLGIGGLIAIITISTLTFRNLNWKRIKQIKYRGVEVTFKEDKIEEQDV